MSRKNLQTWGKKKISQHIQLIIFQMSYIQKQPAKVFYKKRPQACSFIEIETLAQVLSCEFCEIFKNTF